MKIIRSYARIINPEAASQALRDIEWAARISHRSEEAQTADSAERFIRTVVLGHGDWSVVEHVSVSVDMIVDRGITHELVRHRLFSFTQESTRFVNYEKKMPPSFIYPEVGVHCVPCLDGDEPFIDSVPVGDIGFRKAVYRHLNHGACPYNTAWRDAVKASEFAYRSLLAQKWRPQEARSVFPNALASRIVMTGNLRNWRHFFLMRTTKEAHPQMREVTIPLLGEFQNLVPVLFEDIVPEGRQVENIAKGR